MSVLISLLVRVLVAALIFLVGQKIAKVLRAILAKTFDKTMLDDSLKQFLLSVCYVGMLCLVIFAVLEQLGVPSASIIAVLGSAGIAIGLSLKESLANFAGGILILLMRPFLCGDYIVCGTVEGIVEEIGLVYTKLRTADNKAITIPNGTLSNATVINVTDQEMRRVDVTVGIGYQSDLKRAKEILKHIFENHDKVLKDEEITVFVDSLGDSAVVLGGRAWTATADYWTVRWDVLEAIKLRFDEAGIEIPFNQIDINIKKEV